jgi:hypothetical protein
LEDLFRLLKRVFALEPAGKFDAPRMHCRYGYYNFVKFNSAIRCTPAMAVDVTTSPWTVRDLVEMIEA